MSTTVDLMDVITALSGIQSSLRMLQSFPDRYPPDGHWPRVIAATRTLEQEVTAWMHTSVEAERRHADRRQAAERRHQERRHRLDQDPVTEPEQVA